MSSRERSLPREPVFIPTRRRLWAACCALYALFLLLAACTSTPPIARIGVLAPFEGLYRRSGYTALEAMRATLQAHSPGDGDIGLMPLALDTSRDAARAAQKVKATPDVRAVIGPLSPLDGLAQREALAGLAWFAPYAASEDGFVDPGGAAWLSALIRAVAADARALGSTTLAVAGWQTDAPDVEAAALPLTWIDSPLALRSGDGLLWLGDAAGGARFVAALRERLPGTPVWLAPWAVDDVLVQRLKAASFADWKRLYWIVWLDPGYAAWAELHAGADPFTWLIERATQQAIAAATGAPPLPAETWQPALFELTPSGESLPFTRQPN